MSTDLSGLRSPVGGTSVSEYARLLRRFWWIVVAGSLLGTLAGAAFVVSSPSTYLSTTTVLVGDTGIASAEVANARNTAGGLNLDTEAQIVTSGTVGERAAAILHYDGPVYGLRNRVAVRVPPNSGVLLVDFTADDPTRAKKGSTAFAQAYLDNRESTAQTALDRRTQRLTDSLADLRARLTEATRKATQTRSVQARSEVDQLSRQIDAATAALAAASLQEIDPGSIISQASPAKSSGSTSLLLLGIGGALLGMILGLGVAVLLDRLRVGRVGRDDLSALNEGSTHLVRAPSSGAVGEAEARRMWAWLNRMAPGDLDTLVVAAVGSSSPIAARTALALAETRAEEGDAVAFANSDLAAEDALVEEGVFASLPANARSAKLKSVVGSSLMLATPSPKGQALPGHVGGVLRWLARSSDAAVFHVSALPESAEAADLAPDSDVVLVVALIGRTRRRELDASLAMLRALGGARVAVVAVQPKRARRADRRTGGGPAEIQHLASGRLAPPVQSGTGTSTGTADGASRG